LLLAALRLSKALGGKRKLATVDLLRFADLQRNDIERTQSRRAGCCFVAPRGESASGSQGQPAT